MKRLSRKLSYVAIAAWLSGCASTTSDQVLSSHTQEIADYVIPVKYQNHTCPQLGEEAQRLWVQIGQIESSDGFNTTRNISTTLASTVVLMPVAVAVAMNSAALDERKRMIAELSTVKKVSIKKNCEWARGRAWSG